MSAQIIDYTSYNGWGHALHGWTMREVEPPPIEGWLARRRRAKRDRQQEARYRSVMVHSRVYPAIGDTLKYEAERGVIEAEIVGIDPCRDPRDMFTLVFRVVP